MKSVFRELALCQKVSQCKYAKNGQCDWMMLQEAIYPGCFIRFVERNLGYAVRDQLGLTVSGPGSMFSQIVHEMFQELK